MKKTLFSLLCLGFVAVTHAQTDKGDWMVGGNLNLNTAKNNTQIKLSPSAGAFVIPNLALGGNVNLAYSKEGSIKTTAFGIGPFARYIFTSSSNVRPLLHTSLSFLSAKTKVGSESSTNSGTNYFLGGGAAIFINEQVSIDGIMGYDHTKYNSLDGSGGFALNIGFQVYLHRSQVKKLRGE